MVHIISSGENQTFKTTSTIGAGGMLLSCQTIISRGNGRAVNRVDTTMLAQSLLPGLQTVTTHHDADGKTVTINSSFSQGDETCTIAVCGNVFTVNGNEHYEDELPAETQQLGNVLRGLAMVNERVFQAAQISRDNMPANNVGHASDRGSVITNQQPTHTR